MFVCEVCGHSRYKIHREQVERRRETYVCNGRYEESVDDPGDYDEQDDEEIEIECLVCGNSNDSEFCEPDRPWAENATESTEGFKTWAQKENERIRLLAPILRQRALDYPEGPPESGYPA